MCSQIHHNITFTLTLTVIIMSFMIMHALYILLLAPSNCLLSTTAVDLFPLAKTKGSFTASSSTSMHHVNCHNDMNTFDTTTVVLKLNAVEQC